MNLTQSQVPIDIGRSLWYLGRYQELLRLKDYTTELEDNVDLKDSSMRDMATNGKRKRYSLLYRIILSKPMNRTFTLLYDITSLFVLASHVYAFFSLIEPSWALCDAAKLHLHEHREIQPSSHEFNDLEKCKRYNWNFTAAGGFSSVMASLLATIHLAATFCMLVEIIYSWIYEGDRNGKDGGHDAKSDADMGTRETGSRTTGRLTALSEEEHGAGSRASTRRRINKSKSSEGEKSKASSSGSSRLEEVLLECLIE